MRRTSVLLVAAVIFYGRVVDLTTGQPLAHVHVTSGSARALTDQSGRFALHDQPAGSIRLDLESGDVPPQTVRVRAGGKLRLDVRACSTTLDYRCGGPASPAGSGSGSG